MQTWAVSKLLEWSDWVFLPLDKCDRICSAVTWPKEMIKNLKIGLIYI